MILVHNNHEWLGTSYEGHLSPGIPVLWGRDTPCTTIYTQIFRYKLWYRNFLQRTYCFCLSASSARIHILEQRQSNVDCQAFNDCPCRILHINLTIWIRWHSRSSDSKVRAVLREQPVLRLVAADREPLGPRNHGSVRQDHHRVPFGWGFVFSCFLLLPQNMLVPDDNLGDWDTCSRSMKKQPNFLKKSLWCRVYTYPYFCQVFLTLYT